MRFSRAWRLLAAFVCAGALAVGASACAPSEPEPTPSPTQTTIFASEAEALQAAVDVYQQFNAAYFAITAGGEVDYSTLEPLVTATYFEEISADTYFQDNEQHTEGVPSFHSPSVVSISQDSSTASMRVRLCQDVTDVKIVDANGTDVTPPERTDVFPWEIALVWSKSADRLKIEDEGSWQGDDFCAK